MKRERKGREWKNAKKKKEKVGRKANRKKTW